MKVYSNKGSDCTKAKCDTCFRHLNTSVKTIGEFTVTHFRGVPLLKIAWPWSLRLHCRSRSPSLLLHVLLKNTIGKECIVVGCCNRDTDKQLGLTFHRLPKEETRRKLWLNAINRKYTVIPKDWIPGHDGTRVCSEQSYTVFYYQTIIYVCI